MFEMFKGVKINTNEKIIDEILDRFTHEILPTREEFKKELMSGRKMKFYVGADPTGPELHIGHAINLLLLDSFKQLGHEVIVLFGDFTAMLGDPTDKTSARIKLSKNEIEENIKTWKEQVGRIIDFNENNPPKVMRNSAWLSRLNMESSIELAANFTVQQILERDMFVKRLKSNKPIYFSDGRGC